MNTESSNRPPATEPVPSPFAAALPAADVPYDPRTLSRSERRRRDWYLFDSPKLGRPVEVLHRARLAMALECEFDPQVTAWVERPRLLTFNDNEVELCFWTRCACGREQFLLFVDEAATTTDPHTRKRDHRAARDLIDAANLAGLALHFVYETHLVERKTALTTWYRLLPYVQTANALPQVEALERLILEAFAIQARMSFLQLEQTLHAHAAPDVRAVACRLLHSGHLQIDASHPLSRLSVIGHGVTP